MLSQLLYTGYSTAAMHRGDGMLLIQLYHADIFTLLLITENSCGLIS